jgi:hypothetical protein
VLRALVETGQLRFSCIQCDEHWYATNEEMANALKLLDRGPTAKDDPPTP